MSTISTAQHVREFRSEILTSSASSIDPFHTPFDDEDDDDWWTDDKPTIAPVDRNAKLAVANQDTVSASFASYTPRASQSNRYKSSRPYSVHKPLRLKSRQRQKKQNAQAGIRVVTDFSKPIQLSQTRKIHTSTSRRASQPRAFIDLSALQALDDSEPSMGGFWQNVIGSHHREDVYHSHKVDEAGRKHQPEPKVPIAQDRRRQKGSIPSPLNIGNDLSPNDRPIVIGLSIPSARLAQHVTSPETVVIDTQKPATTSSPSDSIVETPTISIRPEQKIIAWQSSLQDSINSVRRAKSSTTTIFSEDEELYQSPRLSRARNMSFNTVFEEDRSPILKDKPERESSTITADKRGTLRITTDNRESRGWWNHILSPFISRSNTLRSPQSPELERPDLPHIVTTTSKLNEPHDDKAFLKQLSPLTPETSTTIASDAWWETRNTIDGTAKIQLPPVDVAEGRRHKIQESSGTLPFMLSAGGLDDNQRPSSAEYILGNDNKNHMQRNGSIQVPLSSVSGPSPSDRLAPFVLVHSASQASQHNSDSALSNAGPMSSASQRTQPQNHVLPLERVDESSPVSTELVAHTDSPQPPPYSPPRRNFPRYRAIYPPAQAVVAQQPPSPGPESPGFQNATASRGGIPMTDVPLTPPVSNRRPINLNSGYPGLPASPLPTFPTPVDVEKVSKRARKESRKLESRRRRHEREDALAHKAGGLWRGRCCIPDSGCYGRKGAEGRKRRRCWFGLIAGFLSMIILTVVLATQLHHSESNTTEQSLWLNLTGFPPMFTGISTISSPENIITNTGCVFPATLWSCSLPKELQSSVAPNPANQPNFRFQVQWKNTTASNETFTPAPAPPSSAEQFFLGNTTDNIESSNKAGEPTPFYITILSASSTDALSRKLLRRQSNESNPFPNVTAFIPPPDLNPDGTAASANLLPLPVQQPIRLYDRGLPTEHYGFYNYFNRSIFLKSTAVLNSSNIDDGEVPDDENGGSTESEALTRCTWAQTRFLVQILNATSSGKYDSTLYETANDFHQPGSFPYPVTITTDRHGGDPALKMIYCYDLDNREHLITRTAQVHLEDRAFGGIMINPAPSVFSNSSNPALGGFDGGTSGCRCQWSNWQSVVNT